MDPHMAIRTNWNKIFYRIFYRCTFVARERLDMVNMDKALTYFTIEFFKVESTANTGNSLFFDDLFS